MNKPGILGLLAAALGACQPGADEPALAFTTAAQSTEGCAPTPTRGLPPTVDRVVVQMLDVASEWQTLGELPREGGAGSLLERVPAGSAELRLVACEGPAARFEARPAPLPVGDSRKQALVAHFRPLGALSCAGTGFGPGYDRFAELPHAHAFGAGLSPTADDRTFVVGGANRLLGDRLQARDEGADWSTFDWREALFWPGATRDRPLTRRPLDQPRVGARAVPHRLEEAEVVLLLGGAPALVLEAPPALAQEPYTVGPLVPAEGVADPPIAVFDPRTGAVAAAELLGGPLTPRVLAGVGRAPDGRVLRAGGVTVTPDGPRPSGAVEVIDAATISTHELPAPLVGPTVTHLAEDAFLVWGADTVGCGQTPGYLVTLDPVFAATPLIFAGTSPPACGDACRDWYASAYHTATPLRPDAAGRARVLIVGGLVVRGPDLLHNPDPGGQCPANAFVITVDVATAGAEIAPVALSADADVAVRRVLHRATPVGARVMLSGGWGSFGKPTSFVAGDEVLFYDDDAPAGGIEIAHAMNRRRFGHLAVALPADRVLLAGGLGPRSVAFDDMGRATDVAPLSLDTSAEIYTPPIQADPCPEAFLAAPLDGGLSADAAAPEADADAQP